VDANDVTLGYCQELGRKMGFQAEPLDGRGFFIFIFFIFCFLQKYIFIFEIYRNLQCVSVHACMREMRERAAAAN